MPEALSEVFHELSAGLGYSPNHGIKGMRHMVKAILIILSVIYLVCMIIFICTGSRNLKLLFCIDMLMGLISFIIVGKVTVDFMKLCVSYI